MTITVGLETDIEEDEVTKKTNRILIQPKTEDFKTNYLSIKVCTLGVSPSLVSRYCEGYSCWSI